MRDACRILALMVLIFVLSASVVCAKSPVQTTVRDSLAWLARHQLPDGRWQFNPATSGKRGYVNPGSWKNDAGATGLALLPFLAAGQTHRGKGPYRDQVESALDWLISRQKPDGDLAADDAPGMLATALAAMAMGEAYGLTGDNAAGRPAQKAVQFIVAQQDAKTGGWRDTPASRSTLSTTVWVIMALRSALMAGLDVPPSALEKADRFLTRFQVAEGRYAEAGTREADPAATSMGLLARMYLAGRPRGHTVFGGRRLSFSNEGPKELPGWAKGGQQFLSRRGLSAEDVVYNLYPTVYIHELAGNDWDTWNKKMRKQLLDLQVKAGDEKGSWWNPADVHAAEGGRLFQTAITTLMLEVYY